METDRTRWRLVVGTLVSLAAMIGLLWVIDGQQVLGALRQIDPLVIPQVLALLLVSLLTRAGAWRDILRGRISLLKSFLIINTGYFVNTILPFRIGEVTRAFLLLPAGLGFWEALPAILLERILDFSIVLIMFFGTLPLALDFTQGVQYATILSAAVASAGVLIVLAYRLRDRILDLISGLRFLGGKAKERLKNLYLSFTSSLKIISEPARFSRVVLLMVITWAITLLAQFILLRAFLPEAKVHWVIFAFSVVSLGISIPSSPGNLGVYEASLTLALGAFGADQSLAFAYALTSHVLSLLVTTLLGSFGLVREGLALGDIWKLRNHSPQEYDI